MTDFRLATPGRVSATLDRMAAEIAVLHPPGVDDEDVTGITLVGILRRGAPLARRLAERLRESHGVDAGCRELELKRYSDELKVLHRRPELVEPEGGMELDGRCVVLVDDVLYSGRTLARAMDYVSDHGAAEVRCALLCVRGRPDLPLRADVVGYRCDVGRGQIVDVSMPPYEPEMGVHLRTRKGEGSEG